MKEEAEAAEEGSELESRSTVRSHNVNMKLMTRTPRR